MTLTNVAVAVADRMVVEILLDVTLGMNFLHSQVSPSHVC